MLWLPPSCPVHAQPPPSFPPSCACARARLPQVLGGMCKARARTRAAAGPQHGQQAADASEAPAARPPATRLRAQALAAWLRAALAFDAAAAVGFPLTLAGHTHGGLIALTRDVTAGSLMFRYTSGLYTRGDCKLLVSNGTGNWFPLRINAPAEILDVTLRRAAGS